MARIRSIKPDYNKHHSIAALPLEVRLHFALLWTYADDEGRGKDDSRLIKGELWPLDDDVTPDRIEGWQRVLADAGRIVRYVVNGQRYFEVVNFAEHQRPQKKADSKLPSKETADPSDQQVYTPTIGLPEDSHTPPVALLPVVGGEKEKEGSGIAPRTARERRDPVWDTMLEACGVDEVTDAARGAYNKAAAQLRGVHATPEQILDRAAAFKMRWPDASLTPTALARRWGECTVANATQPSISKSQGALLRASGRNS